MFQSINPKIMTLLGPDTMIEVSFNEWLGEKNTNLTDRVASFENEVWYRYDYSFF